MLWLDKWVRASPKWWSVLKRVQGRNRARLATGPWAVIVKDERCSLLANAGSDRKMSEYTVFWVVMFVECV